MSQKRKRLTLDDKVNVIRVHEKEKLSTRELATKFDVGKTQVADIIKNKEEILKSWTENSSSTSKRVFPKTDGLAVDSLTYEWFCRARANKIPLSGPLIREKALEIAKEVGASDDFKASGGWLDKFRKRHNISYKNICGEAGSVDENVVGEWKGKLREICDGYLEQDIFNCDETGLFFRAIPDKTMCHKGEKCSGGKLSKERLTVLLCVNMVGEFEKPLIIGKATKPRCFRGVDINSLGVVWRANKRAWMTKEIMTDWLITFDSRMRKLKRNVILFMDNAASHPDATLTHVKIVFLPPNTTSACQPLDQGIIKNFKVLYRQKVLRHILSNMNAAASALELSKTISVLDAIMWANSAIRQITSNTVRNCFKKAGLPEVKGFTGFDVEIDEDECELTELLTPFGLSAEIYVSIDDDLQVEDPSTDVSDLVAAAREEKTAVDDVEDDPDDPECVEEVTIQSARQVMEGVRQLKRYFLYKGDGDGLKIVGDLAMHVEKKMCIDSTKQTKIDQYFKQA